MKAQAERARNAAYALLVELGHIMVRWADGDAEQGIEDYLHMLLAGLHGSPQLMSCTVLAISRVVYELRGSADLRCKKQCKLLKIELSLGFIFAS